MATETQEYTYYFDHVKYLLLALHKDEMIQIDDFIMNKVEEKEALKMQIPVPKPGYIIKRAEFWDFLAKNEYDMKSVLDVLKIKEESLNQNEVIHLESDQEDEPCDEDETIRSSSVPAEFPEVWNGYITHYISLAVDGFFRESQEIELSQEKGDLLCIRVPGRNSRAYLINCVQSYEDRKLAEIPDVLTPLLKCVPLQSEAAVCEIRTAPAYTEIGLSIGGSRTTQTERFCKSYFLASWRGTTVMPDGEVIDVIVSRKFGEETCWVRRPKRQFQGILKSENKVEGAIIDENDARHEEKVFFDGIQDDDNISFISNGRPIPFLATNMNQ